jgi:hypothetical protein
VELVKEVEIVQPVIVEEVVEVVVKIEPVVLPSVLLAQEIAKVVNVKAQSVLNVKAFWSLYRKTFGGNRKDTTCSSCIASAVHRFVEKIKELQNGENKI